MRNRSRCGPIICAVLCAGPALAAGKDDPKGALIAAGVLLVIAPLLQFLVAILLPRFTRRLHRAIATGFWPCAGWGALVAVLTVIVAAILNHGGPAGRGLMSVVLALVVGLGLAGGIGLSKLIGDWALRRWHVEPLGPFTVLCGATVWAWAAAIPIVGWFPGLLTIFAGLGASIQVVLQPRAFDPPAVPELAPQPMALTADASAADVEGQ